MTHKGHNLICEGINNKFKFREYISLERKIKIEQHPQAKEYFRFRHVGNSWRWFVKISGYNSVQSPSKY